jgi:hypothetical protein
MDLAFRRVHAAPVARAATAVPKNIWRQNVNFRKFGFSLLGAVSLVALGAPASAAYVEVGDTGDLPDSARSISVAVTQIEGTLNANPFGPDAYDLVDLYRIRIPNPSSFMASTVGFDLFTISDPVLYLFDSTGAAVAMNDDADGTQSVLADLPDGLMRGIYYLGITFAGVEPTDGTDPLFDAFGDGSVLTDGALAAWQGEPLTPNFDIPGAYIIDLYNVPEPGTFAMMILGLLGVAGARRARTVAN